MTLKEIRNKSGLTRREVIFALEDIGLSITEQTLASWESGKCEPTISDAKLLAKVYKISIQDITG